MRRNSMLFEEDDDDSNNFPMASFIGPSGSSFSIKTKNELNSDLADVTNTRYGWALAGYEAIKDVVSEYEISLPDTYGDLQDSMDELVFRIEGTELFLYLFYEQDDDGRYEFFAEVVNERELEDVLDEIDVGENEDDGDDDDGDDKYNRNNDEDGESGPYYKDD